MARNPTEQAKFGQIDYYEFLGIKPDVDANAVVKAFKSLARVHHPDRNVGKSEEEQAVSADTFKRAQEAYEVLNESERRAMYDEARRDFLDSKLTWRERLEKSQQRHAADEEAAETAAAREREDARARAAVAADAARTQKAQEAARKHAGQQEARASAKQAEEDAEEKLRRKRQKKREKKAREAAAAAAGASEGGAPAATGNEEEIDVDDD